MNYIKSKEDLKTYNDGLTPGGVPFLDMLLEYFIYYIRYVHIPNYILSNQPIIEHLELDKNNKINKLLMSKKFKQKIIRVKEDHSFPVTHSMIVIETETAILNGNVDKAQEVYVNSVSGIREFFTLIRHLLGEESYYYTITQDPFRPVKAVRELQLCYMHVFGSSTRCTSPSIRKIINIYIKILKISNALQINLQQLENPIEVKDLKSIKKALVKSRNWFGQQLIKIKIYKLSKKIVFKNKRTISNGRALHDRLFNKGYLEFQICVYRSLKYVGRRVLFSGLFEGVLIEK